VAELPAYVPLTLGRAHDVTEALVSPHLDEQAVTPLTLTRRPLSHLERDAVRAAICPVPARDVDDADDPATALEAGDGYLLTLFYR
jgi:hypothetical protein